MNIEIDSNRIKLNYGLKLEVMESKKLKEGMLWLEVVLYKTKGGGDVLGQLDQSGGIRTVQKESH